MYLKGFYNINTSESFTIRMNWKGFSEVNVFGGCFEIKMHWKGFYKMNVLERVLLDECIRKDFSR